MTTDLSNPNKLREAALRILALREHSAAELTRKLLNKGFEHSEIEVLVQELESRDWLDETRFAESYVRSRVQHGYGPLRIRQELRQRGVEENTQAMALETYADTWIEAACQARHKRFGEALPQDIKTRAKQARFLTYRGFTSEQIRTAFEWSEIE